MTTILNPQSSRIRLFVSMQALDMYLKSNGAMELTRNGSRNAVAIIEEATGKTYKRSMKGKREALTDVKDLLGEGISS